MRLAHAGAVGLAVALAATACSGPDPQQRVSDPDAITGEVTFWDTSDATHEAPVFKALVKEFEKTYPKVDVTYENVPFDGAQDRFKTAAQSGDGAPDVMRTEVAWTAELASLGYLAPLEDTLAVHRPSDYLGVATSSTRYDGRTYAVPQVTDSLGLLYNKRLLREAGVEEPPATMTELRAAALKVAEHTDAEGFYLNASDGYYLMPHFYAHGARLLDVGEQRITVNDEPAVAALEEAVDLVTSGAAAEPALTDTYATMQTAFKDGQVAMVFNGPWAMGDIQSGRAFAEDPDNLGVAPLPAGPEGQGGPVGGHNYAVYAGSGDLNASYLFVRFMSSADAQARVATELGLLPTRASVYERGAVAEQPVVDRFRPIVADAHPRPWIPEGGLLFQPFETQLPAAVSGEATAQQALDAVAEEYAAALTGWEARR